MKKLNKQINKSTNPNPNPTKKEMGHSKSVEAHTEAPNLAQKRRLLIYLVYLFQIKMSSGGGTPTLARCPGFTVHL